VERPKPTDNRNIQTRYPPNSSDTSIGSIFQQKYRIEGVKGQGVFGVVFKAVDLSKNEEEVAIKVCKAGEKTKKQLQVETKILTFLNQIDH